MLNHSHFSFISLLLHFLIKTILQGRFFLHSFVYLFIYLFISYGLTALILYYKPILSLFIYLLKLFLLKLISALSCWLLCPLNMTLLVSQFVLAWSFAFPYHFKYTWQIPPEIKKQMAVGILIRIKTMYQFKKKVSLQIVSILIQQHGISLHLFNHCQ